MDKLFNDFYKRRNLYINQNIEDIKNKQKEYLTKMDNIRRNIALIISLLIQLKFQLETQKPDKKHLECWNNIKECTNKIKSLSNSSLYCVYRSPSRTNVNTSLVKIVSPTAVCSNIKIHNCYDQFIVDDTIIYGRVKSQYIDLHVYEDTIIRIPKNLIQLEGDTISIQYVDVFSSRCSSMYKYKGIDNGFVLRLHKILNGNMSQENIESAISIGRHLISQ